MSAPPPSDNVKELILTNALCLPVLFEAKTQHIKQTCQRTEALNKLTSNLDFIGLGSTTNKSPKN